MRAVDLSTWQIAHISCKGCIININVYIIICFTGRIDRVVRRDDPIYSIPRVRRQVNREALLAPGNPQFGPYLDVDDFLVIKSSSEGK